ncbi:hypothetical protein ACLB2K_031230 [Fragaria x ananassa]
MSDPSFIGRFLCLQSDKQTEIIRSVINRQGVVFLKRLSSSGKPLTRLFESLMSFNHLNEEPIVVATYNDLVLCCASNLYQRDYYICNAYTNQWVPLPPPPQLCQFAAVGFICDLPYYQCRKDKDNHDHIQLNADYRCHFIEFDQHSWDDTSVLQCVGVNRGHLQMLGQDLETHVLYVVKLNEEVSMAAGKFCLDQRVKNYALNWEMVPDDDAMYLVIPLGFDPSDDGTVYLHIGEAYSIGAIFRYNIHTGEWLKIVEKSLLKRFKFYPWVPTPVPRLPGHARLLRPRRKVPYKFSASGFGDMKHV